MDIIYKINFSYEINQKLSETNDDNSWQYSGSAKENSTKRVESNANFLNQKVDDSSSDDDEDNKSKKIPIIEINMKGYGY